MNVGRLIGAGWLALGLLSCDASDKEDTDSANELNEDSPAETSAETSIDEDTATSVDTDVDTNTATDTATETSTNTGTSTDNESLPEGLIGSSPESVLPAPLFSATSHDGSPRGQTDLIGNPTVIWFYPVTGTYG